MANKSVIKNISHELKEYLGRHSFTAQDEYFEMELNSQATIDDINMLEIENGTTNAYRLGLIYPSTGDEGIVKSGFNMPYFLNQNEGGSGKMWYRVPARTKLRVTCTAHTSVETVSITVLARGR